MYERALTGQEVEARCLLAEVERRRATRRSSAASRAARAAVDGREPRSRGGAATGRRWGGRIRDLQIRRGQRRAATATNRGGPELNWADDGAQRGKKMGTLLSAAAVTQTGKGNRFGASRLPPPGGKNRSSRGQRSGTTRVADRIEEPTAPIRCYE